MVIIVSEPVADQRSARIDGRGKIVPLHKSRLTAVRRSGLPLVPSRDGRGWLAAAGCSDSRFVAGPATKPRLLLLGVRGRKEKRQQRPLA